MRQKFFSVFIAALVIASLNQATCNKNKSDAGCIDKSKISNGPCTMEYDPVCGCDNKTYSNPCVAENAGVTKWTMGECK